METIIGVIIGVAAVTGVLFVLKKLGDKKELAQLPDETATSAKPLEHKRTVEAPTHHELFRLQLQDAVSYLGTDYLVEGRIDMEDEGDVWSSYMLVDGHDVIWLCVEDDDDLEVSLWTQVEDCPIPDEIPEVVEYQGKRFQLIERGTAKASQLGLTGRKSGKKVRYFDYSCPGEEGRLSIEIWRGEVEVYTGQGVTPSTLEIYPHDGRVL